MFKQTAIGLLGTTLLVAGCGGGGSSSSDNSNTDPALAGAATTTQKTNTVIASSVQLSGVISGSRSTASSLKKPGQEPDAEALIYAKLAEIMEMRPSRQGNLPSKVTDVSSSFCSVSGTANVTTPDDPSANPYTISIAFSDCSDGSSVTNGVMALSETDNLDGTYDYSFSMGDGDTTRRIALRR